MAKTKTRFIAPMLLLRTDQLPEGDQWSYEIKLDGYRALAIKTSGKVELVRVTTTISRPDTRA